MSIYLKSTEETTYFAALYFFNRTYTVYDTIFVYSSFSSVTLKSTNINFKQTSGLHSIFIHCQTRDNSLFSKYPVQVAA